VVDYLVEGVGLLGVEVGCLWRGCGGGDERGAVAAVAQGEEQDGREQS